MVEETGNSMNMQPAEEEYEYEYIELAEGEELPEGAEYEYEYVEVPAEEILAAAGQSENLAEEYVTASEQIQEDIPQFFREDADVLTADLAETASNEPVFEIEQPGSQPEAENEFDFETVEQVVDEPADFGADFLAQANGELNLDDILDDDSPLPDINVQTDDDFEKSLFGTPEPDLQLEHFESENGTPSVAEELPEEVAATAENLEEMPVEAEGVETVENFYEEPLATDVEGMASIERTADVVEAEKEIIVTEVEPEPELEPEPNILAEENINSVVVPVTEVTETEVVEDVFAMGDVVQGDEEQMVAVEEASAEVVIEQPEEQNAVIPAAEENIAAEDLSEVSIVEDAIVMADVPSEDYQMPARGDAAAVMENASTEEISVGGIEEEAVPVLAPRPALTEKQDKSAEGFQQTEEVPAEVIVSDVNEDDYDSLRQAAFSFSKNGGFQSFQADEKQYNLILEDIDFAVHELSNWSLIIFDDYRLRLNSAEKELVVPKADNIVRFAKILKGGKTKLELFNEERYNFMTPGEEFVKVRGHCIYGNIANNSKLIVKDFINLSLDDKAGKVISFNKPVSGLLTGPKAAKLYFCDIRAVVIPSSARVLQDADKELSRAARWYSGSSADDCFEFDAKTPSTEFTGTDICKIIHVNVGISHYGWNITFANGLFMSFRDLQEYQTRYGQLPDHSGVISHGQQTLKFDKIEKIVIYEAPQYFTYG